MEREHFISKRLFANRKLLYFASMYDIIARKTLLAYCKKYPMAQNALLEWYHELIKKEYKNFNQLKADYPNASIVSDDRVVFNILGNKFRLVVRLVFEFKTIHVKWFGTHAQYDKIDVTKIKFIQKI